MILTFDVVQSGANKNCCKYPLDPGLYVVCANLFNQGVLISDTKFGQFCPPKALLVYGAARLAFFYIVS